MNTYTRKLSVAAAVSLAALLISACGISLPSIPEFNETPTVKSVLSVSISELMASNKATIADPDGVFSDWLEIHNSSDESVSLEGCVLTDGKTRWTIPALTLNGNEYRILFCSKSGAGEMTVPFALSKSGETVSLEAPDGTVIDSIRYSGASADVSIIKGEDGQAAEGEYATPGYENSPEGYEAFQSSKQSGALVINEVMNYNQWYVPAEYVYYDWVELKNVSSHSIELSDYYISDDDDDLMMYNLPEQTLASGQTYILQCVDENYETFNGPAAPFGLDSGRDELYISDRNGRLSDYTSIAGLKYGGSYGRMDGKNGFFFFEKPSPGADNADGARLISAKPTADTPQGVYDDVSTLKVTLSAKGSIYYTLDGSVPTVSSKKYTSPLTISSTTILRCISAEDGKLPSTPASMSYILNDAHELPVVSLVVDPVDFADQNTGIYTNPTQDWERFASVALFDGEDGFAIDCSVKIHGATSREAQQKKSFKLKFKDRFEGELNYDLFGNGVTEFSSVILRAAQESSQSSHLRDILMHELADECYDGLPSQGYKFAVLYLNGEYWGIYSLREAHSVEHYANHYGYSPDTVIMNRGMWDADSPLQEAYNYAHDHDLSDPESFAHLQSLVDMDSVVTWQIIQSYSGNMDINPPNVRFYYSTEDNIGRYALVDLDLGLFNTGSFGLAYESGYQYSYFLNILIYNKDYRAYTAEKLAEYLAGPLSDENVIGKLHSLAAEIRSEIPRDAARWDYDADSWERDLGYIEGRLTVNGGMAKRFAQSAKYYLDMDYKTWDRLFSQYDD